MMKDAWIVTIVILIISSSSCHDIGELYLPDGLKIGAAASAFQVEGAWNVSGKGVSIWDWYTHHHPDLIADHSNADVACDSYHKYEEDVRLIKNLGLDHYRFSISWTRILPTGFVNKISKAGIRYYNNLIDELLANNIEPIVTIHHFDQPQFMEDMGGWTNELIVDWFAEYARVVFKEFGPRVKIFVTINEPLQLCTGYQGNTQSPGKQLLDIGVYLCYHNVLKAHAKAYHIYDKEFRPLQGGRIGLTNPFDGWVLNKSSDTAAIEAYFQFNCGIITHPIYKGDYPKIVKKRIAMISKIQGYPVSRLPIFTPEWISYIKGTADYFGLNHYTSRIITRDPDEALGKYNSDAGVISDINSRWTGGSSSWLKVVPIGFGNVLRKIKEEYNNPLVYVLENGYSDHGETRDHDRISYLRSYLKELIKAVERDGCRVQKYTIWSLLDSFEFNSGYSTPFGLIKVDSNSTSRKRRPKLSTTWLKKVLQTRKLQDSPR